MNGRALPNTFACRAATVDDADTVTAVYLRSRRELVACAPLAHSDEKIHEWIRGQLIPAGRTRVGLVEDQVVGLLAVSSGADCSWIDQLYVLPAWIDHGIGTELLNLALAELRPPVRLYTFQANERARRFYERRGFRPIAFGDGSANEEKCPDVLYEWRPGP